MVDVDPGGVCLAGSWRDRFGGRVRVVVDSRACVCVVPPPLRQREAVARVLGVAYLPSMKFNAARGSRPSMSILQSPTCVSQLLNELQPFHTSPAL